MSAVDVMGTSRIVTCHISEVDFHTPGLLGDILEIWTRPIKEGVTSLDVEGQAWVRREGAADGERVLVCSCKIVFVAINQDGKPIAWKKS